VLLLALSSAPNLSAVDLMDDRLPSTYENIDILKDYLPTGYAPERMLNVEPASPEQRAFAIEEPMTLSKLSRL